MATSAEQQLRQLKLIAELKKGNYPNAKRLAAKLRETEEETGQPMGCCERTVLRDIKTLQVNFGAPIAYDFTYKGFYLTDPDWVYQCPVFQEDFVSMAILGTNLSLSILPEPLKSKVGTAVAEILATNKGFFDDAMIDTLLCASGVKVEVDAALFNTLFRSWLRKRVVRLKYRDIGNEEKETLFEPHILAFLKGVWYAKGYLSGTREQRVFACHRMLSVEKLSKGFELDLSLLEETRRNGLFNFPKIKNIKLRCASPLACYIYEQQKTYQTKIQRERDGSLLVTIPEAVEYKLLRWILAAGGDIEVISPIALRRKVCAWAQCILDHNSCPESRG